MTGFGWRSSGWEDADRTTSRRSTNWQLSNVDLAALCDLPRGKPEPIRSGLREAFRQASGPRRQPAQVIDDRSIDAMTFATPNHWHSLAAIWACQAGKDVYVKSPARTTSFEGRKLVEAARKHQRIVQHGTQCRSSPNIREAIQKLREGVIGKVYLATGGHLQGPRGRSAGSRTQPVPKGLNWDAWPGPRTRAAVLARPGGGAGITCGTSATGNSATRAYTRWT